MTKHAAECNCEQSLALKREVERLRSELAAERLDHEIRRLPGVFKSPFQPPPLALDHVAGELAEVRAVLAGGRAR